MALSIPIITEYVGTGLDKFRQELGQAETKSQKAGLVIKKAFLPATAVVGGLATAMFDAAKGAMEDEAASRELARSLKQTTGATDEVIASTENWITEQGKLIGISDSELRPALQKLARSTGSVEEAQRLANQAMDIAVATGKPLGTVTDALTKALGGNLLALGKLTPEFREMVREGASFDDIMAEIALTMGGAASEAANTAEGRFKRLGLAFDETKESIGAALIPAIEAVLPLVEKFAAWAQDNPETFMIIAGALGAMALSIMAINLAMSLNPIGLIAIGIIGLIAGLIAAYKRFEGFRKLVDTIFDGIKLGFDVVVDYLKFVAGIYKEIFNGIAKAWNNTVGKLSFEVPGWVPGIGGKGFSVPKIPMLADGGIVTGPTLALIGEAGPEAVVPLDRMGSMGGGDVNIYVQGADPNAVVDALRTYMFRNGSVPIRVS
jgi:hypothetical protein